MMKNSDGENMGRVCNDLSEKIINVKQYISNNIGDYTSSIIVSFLSEIQTKQIPLNDTSGGNLLATGSILQHVKNNDTVWGSGFMYENSKDFDKDITVKCVRGPLTRQILINNKVSVPFIFCDPGVLIPYIYHNDKNILKEYNIGIIPHMVDYEKVLSLIKDDDIKIINIQDDPEKVVKEISKCKNIISSSLHGIIISEALNIPSAWCKFSDKVLGNGFKFKDYYLGSGRKEEDIYCSDFREKINISKVKYLQRAQYDIDGLLKSFPYHIDQILINDIKRWFNK